ncbi:MAG: nucleotidyltransferase domain-containing protein [Deltaproteobacteria bacterium]|jgi:predicted nucleotidyltransferase|nr:nucleotidyltransferase domain-containing protein [Deltaproteobacteria bacterium]MCL5880698.1 nucleotidyltransferase domain-containing protein [Deltaproteobacteria bacterium]
MPENLLKNEMQYKIFDSASLLTALEEFFKRNAEHFNLAIVFLFGSRAGGFPRKDSDIDIGVIFNDLTLSEESIFLKITDMSLDLIELTKLDVNVIPVYPDFRKPLLYYNIIVAGKPLYIKDFNQYVEIKNEAIFQMEDFNIFGKKWQTKVARKKLEEIAGA